MTLARRALLALGFSLVLPLAAAAQPAPVASDDRVMGRADAPVTVIAYVSPTCSHCADWGMNELPIIRERFVRTGHIRLVVRELMTAPVDAAFAATAIARCAPESAYFTVLETLFRGQEALYQSGDISTWLMGAARAGGMDQAAMIRCLNDEAALERVQARWDQARADGVTSTPTFFVNGRRLQGHGLEALEREIARSAPAAGGSGG